MNRIFFFQPLLATRFPTIGPSASFMCRLASNGWSLAAKWAQLLIASNSCLSIMGRILLLVRFSVVEVDWVVSSVVVVGCLVAGPSVVVVAGSGVFLPGVVWSEVVVSSWVVVSVDVTGSGPEVVASCWVVVNSDSDVVDHDVGSLVVSAVGEVSAVVVGSSVVVEVSVVETN